MKTVLAASLAMFFAGCAGSQPSAVSRASEAPASRPAPPRREAPRAAPSRPTHTVAAKPVSAPVPVTAEKASPPPSAADVQAAECSHMLEDIGRARELNETRSEGASAAGRFRATLIWIEELAALDEQHPSLHRQLKLRVAAMSAQAIRSKEVLTAEKSSDAELGAAGAKLGAAIEAIGEYCAPQVLV